MAIAKSSIKNISTNLKSNIFALNGNNVEERLGGYISQTHPLTETELLNLEQNKSLYLLRKPVDGENTFTYLRCYYRLNDSANTPNTTYIWAVNPQNPSAYYKIYGYWSSGITYKWMRLFYTDS